jgi:uncharacterized protein YjiS (DUF1127 family)
MVMQQIAQWLETLGMSEYAPRFIENRVDFSVLRDLTDQDLKDIGVLLGDRRKLLRPSANSMPRRRWCPLFRPPPYPRAVPSVAN